MAETSPIGRDQDAPDPTAPDCTTLDRTAIVTGGSRGIGRAVAAGLLAADWRVHICSRDPDTLNAALDTLGNEHGTRIAGRVVDVCQQEEVDAFVAAVLDVEGAVDCLINNAGRRHFAPVDAISGDDWRRIIATNLDGPFYFLRATAPSMRTRQQGMIINIASLAARHAFAGGAAYNASKFGLLGLAEAAMLDLRGDGVRVVTLLPGSVDTDFHSERRDSDRQKNKTWMLRPEDVAQTVLDLLRYPPRALPSIIELRPTRTSSS